MTYSEYFINNGVKNEFTDFFQRTRNSQKINQILPDMAGQIYGIP